MKRAPSTDLEDVLHDAIGLAFLIGGKAELAANMAETEGRLRDAQRLRELVRTASQHAMGHLSLLSEETNTDEALVEMSHLLRETGSERAEIWAEIARANGQGEAAEWFERVGAALVEAEEALDVEIPDELTGTGWVSLN